VSCPKIGLHQQHQKMKRNSKFISGLSSSEKLSNSNIMVFTREEKLSIIKDYFSSGESKQYIWEKYTGRLEEHGDILRWMRQLCYSEDNIKTNGIFVKNKYIMKSESKPLSDLEFEHLQLKKRIEQLEKQVQESELKAIAFSTMVDSAERELHINIKKTSISNH
jgi:hypothetical protein